MPVNVGNSENIVLEGNGAINLQGTGYGSVGMVLTSNANGQAYWDWLDYALQHPGADNTFKTSVAVTGSNIDLQKGNPGTSGPGKELATTGYSGTGYRVALLCGHASLRMSETGLCSAELRVCLQEQGGSYTWTDYASCEGTSKTQSPNVSVPGGGSYGGSTISWNNEAFHKVHAVSVQTITPIDPTKSYRGVLGGWGEGTGTPKCGNGSIRVLFFK